MNKILFTITAIVSSIFLFSCKSENSTDTLRMSITSEPDSFFPWNSAAADTSAIYDNIFEGLTGFDEHGTIYNALAENYSVSSDNLTYTFNLRKGVKFHNGEEFTSKDCVYTYENLAGLNGKTPRADKMHVVEKVWADDDYTFSVKLKKITGGFPGLATSPILLHDYSDNEKHPVGTGPYKFVEYTLHEKVVLERNDEYYDSSRAGKIKNIELYIITDENAAISALKSGQIHIAQMISGPNARHLNSQFKVVSHPQNMVQILGMNTTFPPFTDINVRKAINCAVNKKEIIKSVFDGYGTELYSNFSPILAEFYNNDLKDFYPSDIKKAKEYMEKSSYKDGFDLTITVPSNYQSHVDTAQIIQNQLAKINIRCKILPVEWTSWLDRVYTKFDYEATVIAFAGKVEPAEVLRRYYSTYKRNFTRLNSPEFDKYFDMAETESNQQKRAEYYKECQKILTQEAPAVFICDPGRNIVMKKNVCGYTPYPIARYDFSKIYFE